MIRISFGTRAVLTEIFVLFFLSPSRQVPGEISRAERQIGHDSSSWNIWCCKFQFAHMGICWGLHMSLYSNLTSLFLTSELPYVRRSLRSECFPTRVNAVMWKWREYCISDVPSLRASVLCRSLHLQMPFQDASIYLVILLLFILILKGKDGISSLLKHHMISHVIAQAVSRWLLTSAAQDQT
jgi:hypothetical protein